jgi:hypothetical protein
MVAIKFGSWSLLAAKNLEQYMSNLLSQNIWGSKNYNDLTQFKEQKKQLISV